MSQEQVQEGSDEKQYLKDQLAAVTKAYRDLEALIVASDSITLVVDHKLDLQQYTPAAAKAFAIRASDRGRPVTYLTRYSPYAEWEHHIAEVLRTGIPDEREVQGTDDHWYLTRIHPHRPPDVQSDSVVITFVDITERKRVEDALRRREEEYRTLFESIDEGFCVIEVLFRDEMPVDYRFLQVNPSFEQQTGLHNAVGERMRTLAPEHEQHWFDIYGRIATTGQPERFMAAADALGRWYDVYAFRIGSPEARQVAVLFNDITARHKAEAALHELNETLEARVAERTAEVRELAVALTLAEQKERQRIAQVLHDDLQQVLYSQVLRLHLLRRTVAVGTSLGSDEAFEQLIAENRRAITVMRTLVTELTPPLSQQGGFPEALRWLATSVHEMHGLNVHLTIETACEPRDRAFEMVLLQIIRELLFNVVKHAGTTDAALMLTRVGSNLHLTVQDDGVGFDPDVPVQSATASRGFGLRSIAERLHLLEGHIDIAAAPGKGSRITLMVPCGEDQE